MKADSVYERREHERLAEPKGMEKTAGNPPPNRYNLVSFRADLVAGLTVAAVAVPQAMAYALIAGVEPRYGLDTAIVMAALGSLFSSSSHLISGPTNAISLAVFGGIASLHLEAGEVPQAVFLLAIMVGAIQVLIFTLKLGDLTRFVSESVILGFMLGAGGLIALSQMPTLLGLSPPAGSSEDPVLVRLIRTLFQGGDVKPAAVALGLGTVLIVIGLRQMEHWFRIQLPDLLLAVILVSLAAYQAGWEETKLADVPARLPAFHIPKIQPSWIRGLSGSALAVALLGLLEALAVAKSIASRTHQPLDCNRLCLSEGLANLGGGFFQCIPGAGSLTRSSINYQAGAVSRVSGLISAAAVALAVLLFARLTRFVPRPALSGVLLVTAWRLIDRPRILYCLRATSFDRKVLLLTAGAAVFISIEFSILIGVFLSFMFFIPRAARLGATELTVSHGNVIHERHPEDPTCNKLVVLGLEGELFFGAAPELDQYLEDLSARVERGVRVVVLRLKRARNPDMVCLERLQHFIQDMRRRGVPVLLCGVRPDFAEAMARLHFADWLPAEHVFLEVSPGSSGDLMRYEVSGKRPPVVSSTLKAIQWAYKLLGDDLCPSCYKRHDVEGEQGWSYMI
jgi:SulP family sulfate permease